MAILDLASGPLPHGGPCIGSLSRRGAATTREGCILTVSFSNLSPPDFEDLARDLVGRAEGLRLEAFGRGPDGGADGRHAKGGGRIILQAKHYAGSTFADLVKAMRREKASIDALQPDRYLLATSRPLSPKNKATLAGIIGPALKTEADIFSAGDLEGLLRSHDDIYRAHIKLWLSSAAVLERIVHAARFGFAAMTEAEIRKSLTVYVENASFPAAREHLEANHVLIVSGAPGVGKTTLAQILAWDYAARGWELTPMESVSDGLAPLPGSRRVFLFDDFLGHIDLETSPHEDSKLARFIRRVIHEEDNRFILTTRAYVLEGARKRSEPLANPTLDLLRYVLDVGAYTRQVRARILYNHLCEGGAPAAHIEALVRDPRLAKIIDHPNYSPRIIDWMTNPNHLREVGPETYVEAFLAMLKNPKHMWEIPFRTHIAPRCRHLLIALFLSTTRSASIAALRHHFSVLHPLLCQAYGLPHAPNDFEAALSTLEGGFLVIHNGQVSFLNPSVRDFLKGELSDPALLATCAGAVTTVGWAAEVWRQAQAARLSRADLTTVLTAATLSLPLFITRKTQIYRDRAFHEVDLPLGRRLALLADWWARTEALPFGEAMKALALSPPGDFNYADKDALLDLIVQIRSETLAGFPFPELPDLLEEHLEAVFLTVATHELRGIADALNESAPYFTQTAWRALANTIDQEFDSLREVLRDVGSDVELLEEHKELLRELAPFGPITEERLTRALETIDAQIAEAWEHPIRRQATPPSPGPPEPFGDDEVASLFSSLLR